MPIPENSLFTDSDLLCFMKGKENDGRKEGLITATKKENFAERNTDKGRAEKKQQNIEKETNTLDHFPTLTFYFK